MSRALFIAYAASALITLYLIKLLYTNLSHARRARQVQCRPAYTRPHRLPFGIDLMRRYMRAAASNDAQSDDLLLYTELGNRATWCQNLLSFWHHVTADPKNIQAMLATQFGDFELGPVRSGSFEPLIGHGIFTSDGKDWTRSRALLRPQFARDQITDLKLVEVHVQHLLNRLDICSQGWTDKVDLAPLFFNLTLDSATEFLFGRTALSQLEGRQEKTVDRLSNELDWSNFGHCFDSANAVVTLRGRLMDLYFLYNPKGFKGNCRQVHRYVDSVVDRALSNEKQDAAGEQKYVFLNELIKTTQDRDELRSQLLNILLAGRDTTAGLLGWTFYYLARHQHVYDKLRQTIVESFGTTTDSISFETLKSCTYLQYVMREILRLEPVVPENSRRAAKNTTLPRGGGPDGLSPIYIKKGEEVIYNTFIMHRRKDIWGEDADDFKPERWEGLKNGWEYLPFNGGPRVCLGQQFALTEAGYVIVRMLQRFDRLENLDQSEEIKRRLTSTTSPVEVTVRLHEA